MDTVGTADGAVAVHCQITTNGVERVIALTHDDCHVVGNGGGICGGICEGDGVGTVTHVDVGQAANVQRSRRFEGVCTVAQIDGECARNPEGSSGSLFFKQYGIVTVATEYAEGSAEVVTSQIANSSPVEQNPEIVVVALKSQRPTLAVETDRQVTVHEADTRNSGNNAF